jgi:hypothetical protein
MNEIITKLEVSIKESLGLNLRIYFHKGEIVIYGLKNEIENIQALIFIHGFLACWKIKNDKVNLSLFNPEVG